MEPLLILPVVSFASAAALVYKGTQNHRKLDVGAKLYMENIDALNGYNLDKQCNLCLIVDRDKHGNGSVGRKLKFYRQNLYLPFRQEGVTINIRSRR